jgi:hypothetical protein
MIVVSSGALYRGYTSRPCTIGMQKIRDRRVLFLIPQAGCFEREKFDGVQPIPAYLPAYYVLFHKELDSASAMASRIDEPQTFQMIKIITECC